MKSSINIATSSTVFFILLIVGFLFFFISKIISFDIVTTKISSAVFPKNNTFTEDVQGEPVTQQTSDGTDIAEENENTNIDENTYLETEEKVTRTFFLIQQDSKKSCSTVTVGYPYTYTSDIAEYKTILEKMLVIQPGIGTTNVVRDIGGKIDKVDIDDGVAKVYITSTGIFSSTCMRSQFVEQIRKTGLQFPNINSVQIFVNNIRL